jgi:cysteine-rich repeat protein
MKKYILITLSLFLIIPSVIASWDLRDYFILDKWHDIWDVTPTSSWYYIPKIPYTDTEKVQKKLLENYDYVWDFYKEHNFLKEYIDWKNNNSYFYVKWTSPALLKWVDAVRSVKSELYYYYRKNWEIKAQKGSTMPSNFITGYNSADNKIIILYPIKDMVTDFTVAFIQYPCWNLVCRDENCSALKPKKKDYECSIELDKTVIYDNEDINIKIKKNYNELELESLYVNWKVFVENITKDYYTVNSPKAWTYTLKVTWKNPITKEEIICNNELKVLKSSVCWDKIIDKWEQCDDGNKTNWDGCDNTCKYESPACTIKSKYTCVENWEKLENIFDINKSYWVLDKILVNKNSVDKSYKFTTWWNQTVSLSYINQLNSSINNICSVNIKVRSKAFCWDWLLNNNEVCDPNDSLTWPLCSDTCTLKKPNLCDISISWDLITWKKLFIWITKDYYSKINTITINEKEINIIDKDYWAFTFTKSWSYQVKVELWNKLDWWVSTTCTKEIQITDIDPCR